MTRQLVAQNVIVPPAELDTTITTTGTDQTSVLHARGLTRYCLVVDCPEACIVDLEEGNNDDDTGTWKRVTNIDSVTLPFTTTGGTPFVMRGEKYAKNMRLKIRESTTPGAAVIHLYVQ